MKKLSILFLATFLFAISFQLSKASNSSTETNSEITLKKESVGGPIRVPAQNPVSFYAFLSDNILSVDAENYSSTVLIEITGAGGMISRSFDFGSSNAALMDLSALADGDYQIRVITEGKGVFIGNFIL